ncbi:unnamed protein product [Lactuca virosa]|uniref:Uncharacterized protein n=1 Tax=Lactuca virosa TaxID=75947 RepID=A0AAU9MVN4_9ASTR|nr:unnamed protein product [Lactuca virosa]
MKDRNKESCKFWKWVDGDEEELETNLMKVKISILENDLKSYKMKTDEDGMSFRKKLDEMSRTLEIQKCCLWMLFVLLVVKFMMWYRENEWNG